MLWCNSGVFALVHAHTHTSWSSGKVPSSKLEQTRSCFGWQWIMVNQCLSELKSLFDWHDRKHALWLVSTLMETIDSDGFDSDDSIWDNLCFLSNKWNKREGRKKGRKANKQSIVFEGNRYSFHSKKRASEKGEKSKSFCFQKFLDLLGFTRKKIWRFLSILKFVKNLEVFSKNQKDPEIFQAWKFLESNKVWLAFSMLTLRSATCCFFSERSFLLLRSSSSSI